MKVKFNRGPRSGDRAVLDDSHFSSEVIRIQYIPPIRDWNADTPVFPMRQGEYRRSNRVLKDGTRIYEWMGWLDGKV